MKTIALLLLAGACLAGEPAHAIAEPLAVDLVHSGALPLLAPGQRPSLRLANRGAARLAAQVELEAWRWRRPSTAWSLAVDLEPGAAQTVELPEAGAEGLHRLRYRLRPAGGAAVEGLRSWTVLPAPAVASPGFTWAVCSHTERYGVEEQDLEVEAVAASGAGMLRAGQRWRQVQPAAGRWDWSGLDRLVDALGRRGIAMQHMFGYGVEWALAAPAERRDWVWTCPPRPEAWRTYVRAVAERYRGRIPLYEVWNEPDFEGFFRGSTAQYLELLRIAHAEVRAADPAARVMTGGFATLAWHAARSRNPDLMERVVREAPDAFDILAFHQHGPFARWFRPVVDGPLAELRRALPADRPLFFNETAETFTWSDVDSRLAGEERQADELIKKAAYARALGAIGYTWYNLRDSGTDGADKEHNFGLLTRAFAPKAAFMAWRRLLAATSGMRCHGLLPAGEGACAVAFTDGAGAWTVVLWRTDDSDPEPLLALAAAPGARLAAEDAAGLAQPLAGGDGTWRLHRLDHPLLLRLAGSAAPPRLVPLVEPAARLQVVPGRAGTAVVRLANPGDAAHVELALALPGSPAPLATAAVELAAGATSAATLAWRSAPAGLPAGPGRLDLRVAWRTAAAAWTAERAQAAMMALVVPSGGLDGRDPDLEVSRPEQCTSLVENIPFLAHLRWRGPDDCSLRAWLAVEDDRLRVRLAVRDDRHRQAQRGADIRLGDSVVLALRLPGRAGCWRLGAARHDDGATLTWCWSAPAGLRGGDLDLGRRVTIAAAAADVDAADGLDYRFDLPLAALGLDRAALAAGIGLDVQVTDDDDGRREAWLEWAPGLAVGPEPDRFPLVVFPVRDR